MTKHRVLTRIMVENCENRLRVAAQREAILGGSSEAEDRERAERREMLETAADGLAQLRRSVERAALFPSVWERVEAELKKGRSTVVVVIPTRGAVGAGIGTFLRAEVEAMRLPETVRAFMAQLAGGALEAARRSLPGAVGGPNGGGVA